MRTSRRLLLPTLGLVVALVAGCGGDDEPDARAPGSTITTAEAKVLADVLYEDFRSGGADFTLTAPYAESATITLTGQVDFKRGVGSAHAVTDLTNGQADETRTLFFTGDQIWFGDVPGLADALTAAGLPAATYVKRPISTTTATGTASLIDVLVQLVPRLSARSADDPRSFRENGWTWTGSNSINGRLTSVFSNGRGTSIAVDADDQQLVQYATKLPDQAFTVTISLSDHGDREITLPADADTLDATAHPDVAAQVGV